MLPTAQHVERRLAQIIRRGSLNVGAEAATARLMVMLTRSCDLRCSYCMVKLSEADYQRPHPGVEDPAWQQGLPPAGDMAAATLRRSIDRLMTSEKPRLGIQWFGGEPLRSWDVLLDGIRWAIDHPRRQGRDLELLLTTNGIGLDPERLAVLSTLPVLIQFSLDGDARGSRFRRGHLMAHDVAVDRMLTAVDALRASGVRWFMNATLPPSAADEVMDRYRWARHVGVPMLQMNYATGMTWSDAQQATFLAGLQDMLRDHAARPQGLHLLNWQNHADPVPLCADVIVDVDGTVFQTAAVFHEKRFPTLKAPYRRGHVDDDAPFDRYRFSLDELWRVTEESLSPAEWAVFRQNVELGAAVDLVVQLEAHRLRRAG
jgi:molybdenum cofactor biosynthesis enzyme MoaA